MKDESETFAFDDSSASVIKLNNGTVLYFREVGHYLAVVCILREENFERRGENPDFHQLIAILLDLSIRNVLLQESSPTTFYVFAKRFNTC